MDNLFSFHFDKLSVITAESERTGNTYRLATMRQGYSLVKAIVTRDIDIEDGEYGAGIAEFEIFIERSDFKARLIGLSPEVDDVLDEHRI